MIDASPQRPLLLLLFDLNGFKAYNEATATQRATRS